MRAYTVATTAITLETSTKWVDNALSHFHVPGVLQSRQGVARKLTPQAILTLAIGLRLVRDLAIPLQPALGFAKQFVELGGTDARLTVGQGSSLGMDVASFARDISAKLADAVEITPTPPRGRPPRTRPSK